jgi:hypothetical protein
MRQTTKFESSVLRSERYVNAGQVQLAVHAAEKALDEFARLPWPIQTSARLLPLLMLLHRTLQNAYREYPGFQWRACHHLEMAKIFGRELKFSAIELQRLHMEELAVRWNFSDFVQVKRLLRQGLEFSEHGHPLRTVYLGRRAEYLHHLGLYSHESRVLAEIHRGETTEAPSQYSAHHLQEALLRLSLHDFEGSQTSLEKAQELLSFDRNDYFSMLAHYHQARLRLISGDRAGAASSFVQAETLRLRNHMTVRGIEDLAETIEHSRSIS